VEYATARKVYANYNEKLPFVVICGVLSVLLFFDADELFGAVGLRASYSIGSVVVSVILRTFALSLQKGGDARVTQLRP